jgi:hypothetical protein
MRALVPEDLSRNGQAQRRSLIRSITAMTLAGLRNERNAVGILRAAWPGDNVAEAILKASTTPTSTASAPVLAVQGIGALVLLAPSSAALRLFQNQLQINLAPSATVRIPNVATPPVAPFIAELAPAPVVQAALGTTVLGPTRGKF